MGPRIRGTPHFWPAWNVGHDTFRSDELPGVGAAFALLAGSRRPMGRNLGGAGCSDQTLHGSSFAGCFALETMASLDLGSADGVGPVGHKPDASRAEDVRQLLYLAPISRVPAWVYVGWMNQSLLGTILRLTHAPIAGGSLGMNPVFLA